jgi:serine/threonine-protein kinase
MVISEVRPDQTVSSKSTRLYPRVVMSFAADRNLLFGILALQLDFIDGDQLVKAMHAWVLAKDKPLGQIHLDLGALGQTRRALLEPLVDEHIQRHDGDLHKSLAAVGVADEVQRSLTDITDAEVQRSLTWSVRKRPVAPANQQQANETDQRARERFRRLHLHARGGLGEVFVATDEQLNREVALKEIKPEHALREEFRSRFLREGEITGRLEHPGIVPVYAMGRYEDGRLYYAMRFIHGESMQAAIHRFHQQAQTGLTERQRLRTLRELLERFVDVCQAVAYAHSRGVLHRDLKPSNVMLGKFGETLLVDWGLARPLAARAASDPAEGAATVTWEPPSQRPLALTEAGDGMTTPAGQVWGTPPYMSPEQAAGKPEALSPASDVYSLGATLYHVLTGKPPFAGSSLELVIGQVQRGEFPRPRTVRWWIPRALEAICLKAMALAPQERYAGAQALAVDVEHWLADEPVAARAEPFRDQAARWARRHRALVGSLGVALLLATVFLTTLALLNVHQTNILTAANARQREAAELAQQTIEGMTSEAALQFLETTRELHPEQRKFLEQALAYYQNSTARKPLDTQETVRQAKAYFQMGHLQNRLGLSAAAEGSYRAAVQAWEQLMAEQPQVPEYRQELGKCQNRLGVLLVDLGKRADAERQFRAALQQLERPGGEQEQAPDQRRYLAKLHNNLGLALKDQGKLDEAEKEYRASIKEHDRLVANYPLEPEYRKDLGTTHDNLGQLLAALGKRDEAEREYGAALKQWEQLATEHPQVGDYRFGRAQTRNNLGLLLANSGKRAEAQRQYAAALQDHERLLREQPQVTAYRQGLAQLHNNWGNLLKTLDKSDEAERHYRAAIREQERLVAEEPKVSWYRQDLAKHRNALGILLFVSSKHDLAEREFRAAFKERQRLVAEEPLVPEYRRDLADSHNALGILLATLGKPAEAEREYRAALKEKEWLVARYPQVPDYHNELAGSLVNLAVLRHAAKAPAEARQLLEQAGTHHEVALRADPRNVTYHKWYRNNLVALCTLCFACRDHTATVAAAQKLASLMLGQAQDYYLATSFVSRAVVLAERDTKLSEGKRKELAKKYADQAMDLLRQAVTEGYKNVDQLKKDPQLAPLRQRADFQKLLADLEVAS